MKIIITGHAKERIAKYGLSEKQVKGCILTPKFILNGNFGRKIAQTILNGYVLRVIYEESGNEYTVVTAYKAKRERYEV